MARGQDTGDHPGRQVGPPKFTGQGWPATSQEWAGRGGSGSPVRSDDVSLGEHEGWHYIQHRPGDDPARPGRSVQGTGGIKATRPASSHAEHTQVTQATAWAGRAAPGTPGNRTLAQYMASEGGRQQAADERWDRQRGG